MSIRASGPQSVLQSESLGAKPENYDIYDGYDTSETASLQPAEKNPSCLQSVLSNCLLWGPVMTLLGASFLTICLIFVGNASKSALMRSPMTHYSLAEWDTMLKERKALYEITSGSPVDSLEKSECLRNWYQLRNLINRGHATPHGDVREHLYKQSLSLLDRTGKFSYQSCGDKDISGEKECSTLEGEEDFKVLFSSINKRMVYWMEFGMAYEEFQGRICGSYSGTTQLPSKPMPEFVYGQWCIKCSDSGIVYASVNRTGSV